ncbi:MAG: N-acetylmuramoyl-L-alanine amidase [Bacteroidales bacterium]|nr:N-acetylmuramoyl-L-alanine amidase [Bacteroidales bacterium]
MKRTICIVLAVLLSTASWADEHLRLSTVVIDPGHGGKDPGAVSRDKKSYEKTFTLSISQAIADKIRAAYPDVKVILTRSDDRYVTVGGRADIANKEEADLFISVHHNAVASASPNGFSVHVLGQSSKKGTDLYANNMDIVRRENAVILLEDDYSTTYGDFDPNDPESYIFMNLMQNANLEQSVRFAQLVEKNLKGGPIKNDRGLSQDPFLVLWRTAMPAVLLELGFLSNDNDLKVLKSAEDRDKIAERVFRAFKEYKEIYEGTVMTETSAAAQPEEQKSAEKQAAPKQETKQEIKQEKKQEAKQETKAKTVYAVQIFAVGKKLDPKAREFMGYTPKIIQGEKLYKYYIGVSDSLAGARKNLPAIRKKYPDAFLVKITGSEVSRIN